MAIHGLESLHGLGGGLLDLAQVALDLPHELDVLLADVVAELGSRFNLGVHIVHAGAEVREPSFWTPG